jgi:hydrogenase-4 component F
MTGEVVATYLPVAWPALGALALALAPAGASRFLTRLVAAGLGVLALWATALALGGGAPWDALSLWLLLPALALGTLGLWASDAFLLREAHEGHTAPPPEIGRQGAKARRYLALYAAFIATIALVATANGILLMWAGVEATTLASVLLVAHPRLPTAVEAAWKYLAATAVGGLLALVGTVLIAFTCHVPLTSSPATLPPALGAALLPGAAIAFAFAAVGLGTKAGLAPMHGWLPDAHSEAPAPVSALLSGIELATILYALTRLRRIVFVATGSPWPGDLMVALGLASLAVAALFVVGQRDLKRAYAYSSVEHMGLIALGAGIGGPAALGALLHIWTHAFTKSGLFLAAGNVRHRFGSSAPPAADALLRRLPLSGAALALGTWAVAGLPPFGPFFSEWLILRGAVRQGDVWPALAAVALIATIAVGFGRHLPRMLVGGRAGSPPTVRRGWAWERAGEFWPMALLTAFGLVAGLAAPAAFGPLLRHAAALVAAGVRP